MKIGNIAIGAAYLGSKVLTAVAVGATKVWEGVSKYIKFADPAVEAICLTKWDTDGDGFLSKEEAKAVTSLDMVFKGNTEITSFNELEEFINLTTIASHAFYECSNLASIILPKDLSSIGDRAFFVCTSMKSVVIPSNVESIQASTFYNCKGLVSVRFDSDSNLASIGTTAFMGCSSLAEIFMPESVTSLGDQAFGGCSNITSIIIPRGVEILPSNIFNSCRKLTEVIINDDSLLTKIGQQAFTDCTSLKSINLREGITTIEPGAFRTSGLISVIFPSTLTSLGRISLYGCTSLQRVICNAIVPPVSGDKVFDATNNCPIYVPDESVEAYKAATNWAVYSSRIKPLSEYVEPTNE